jgi:putative Holliday junction resolvase
MKILALDFGEAKVGVAIGESKIGIASPRDFFVNDKQLIETLVDFCKAEKVEKVIVGIPHGFRGETAQTQSVREFAEKLEKQGIVVEFLDERFTSKLAEINLREAKLDSRKQKTKIDSEAARIILQDYFDMSYPESKSQDT